MELDSASGEPRYSIAQSVGQRSVNRRDILHIAAPSVDGIKGTSPVSDCKEAIALALVMERYAANLFANGDRSSGILTFPQKLGAEVATRMKASWKAATSGAAAGGTAVLEEGGKFEPLSFNSVDSQFLELRKFAVEEIARVFRVPRSC